MAYGTKFNLTDKRERKAISMLKQQYTVEAIALHFGIHADTLSRKLKDAGINPGTIRNTGKLDMRAMVIDSIYSIKDDSKRSDSALRFLNQYPIQDEDTMTDDTVTKTDTEILDNIRKELDV